MLFFIFQAGSPIGPVLGDWNITVDVTGQTASKRFQVNRGVEDFFCWFATPRPNK